MKTLYFSFTFIFSALAVNAFVYHRGDERSPIIEVKDGQSRERRQIDGGWDWDNWEIETQKRKRESGFIGATLAHELASPINEESLTDIASIEKSNQNEVALIQNGVVIGNQQSIIKENKDDTTEENTIKPFLTDESAADDPISLSYVDGNENGLQHKSLGDLGKLFGGKKGKNSNNHRSPYGGKGGKRCKREIFGSKKCHEKSDDFGNFGESEGGGIEILGNVANGLMNQFLPKQKNSGENDNGDDGDEGSDNNNDVKFGHDFDLNNDDFEINIDI